MSSSLSGLIGALIGALAATCGGLLLEAYKRRRDRAAVCSAFAAAIETQLWNVRTRGHVQLFEHMLAELVAGREHRMFGGVDRRRMTDPIADLFMDRVGTLPGNLPTRVIMFFNIIYALRADIVNLQDGVFEDLSMQAKLIEEDLAIWRRAERDASLLIKDLRRAACRHS